MKHFAISEEDLKKLLLIARSLYFSNEKMFAGSKETTRDYSFKLREVIDSAKEIDFPEVIEKK